MRTHAYPYATAARRRAAILRGWAVAAVLTALTGGFVPAVLAVDTLAYQGYLTDAAGVPLDGDVAIEFALYAGETDTTAVWQSTPTVPVVVGTFSVRLGTPANPLPPEIFEDPLWLGLHVIGDPDELLPRQPLSSGAYAFTARDSGLLGGTPPAGFASSASLSDHVGDSGNPHQVDATQTGAAAALAAHAASSAAHHLRYTDGEAVAAMGSIKNDNPLNHPRYSDSDAVAAILAADGARSTLDADLFDGLDSRDFLGTAGGSVTGDVFVSGLVQAGIFQATDRGVYFPDGSLQTTAVTGSGIAGQTCPAGLQVVGFDSAGDVICGGGLRPLSSVIDDGTDFSGPPCCGPGDMVMAADGTPRLSHIIGTIQGFKNVVLTTCDTPACDQFSRQKVTTGFNWAAGNSSIDVDASGLPRIAYFDGNFDLNFIVCNNATCTSRSENEALAVSSINNDAWVDLAIGSDGLPLLSVFTISGFRVIHCEDALCSSPPTVTLIEPSGRVGLDSHIAIPADGLPVISYRDDRSAKSLKVVKCGNVACSSGNVINTVDDNVDAGRYNDIAIGADGFPVIAYFDDTQNDLELAHCGDPACATATLNSVVTAASAGEYAAVAVGSDGLPIVAYLDSTGTDRVRVVHCEDADCADSDGPHAIAGGGEISGIEIGSSGLPVVGITDIVVQCGRFDCANP